ncbi:hypothetical protein D3Z38_18265 [Clostridiales bacterium]|nr:hypothetical protein [Clostridiales bacterium]
MTNKDDLLKEKLKDAENATWGCDKFNPKWCETCLYRGDKSPKVAYCYIYQKPDEKPHDVVFEGAECLHYYPEKG